MITAIKVLQKVLVNYFYTANAGFFLFVFFVLFGLPISPVAFHLSLISGIIQSQLFVAIVMLIWFLYNLKCLDYILKQLRDPRQSFLFCFSNLSGKKAWSYMLYVQALIYMPVLLYAAAIIWFAAKKHQYLFIAEIVVFNTIIAAASAFIYLNAIQKKQLFRPIIALPPIAINLPKPFFSIPLYFLWNGRKQMLLVTKFFSLLLLYGFIRLYEPDHYDIRPLQLCLLLIAASHSSIIFQLRTFEEEYLAFSRNLPLKTPNRFIRMTAMYACLVMPEFILLLKGYPAHFTRADYPQLILLAVALLSLFHVTLLLEDTSTEQMMRVIFSIMAACFFIILYNPGILLSLAILLLSFVLFNAYYYLFEKKHT